MRTAASDIRCLVSVLAPAAVALALVLLVTAPARADDVARVAPTTSGAAPDGMRVYRDPATGAFVAAPVAGTPPLAASRAFATSAQGLVETPGTSSAGGMTVDLGSSFQSAVTATVDANGHVRTDCGASAGPAR